MTAQPDPCAPARAALRTFIDATGLTDGEVATVHLGVTPAALSGWLSGRSDPKPLHRQIIAIWTTVKDPDTGIEQVKVPPEMWASSEERARLAAATPFRPAAEGA